MALNNSVQKNVRNPRTFRQLSLRKRTRSIEVFAEVISEAVHNLVLFLRDFSCQHGKTSVIAFQDVDALTVRHLNP